jgi:hypothetical protein
MNPISLGTPGKGGLFGPRVSPCLIFEATPIPAMDRALCAARTSFYVCIILGLIGCWTLRQPTYLLLCDFDIDYGSWSSHR